MDVFISYRRDVGSLLAHQIREMLTADGITVFWDKAELSRHTGFFDDEIVQALDSAAYVLLILTAGSFDDLRSHPVFLNEINHAIAARKRIIPICGARFQFPENLADCGEDLVQLPRLQSLFVQQFDDAFHFALLGMMTELPRAAELYRKHTVQTVLMSKSEAERAFPLEDRLCGDVIAVDSVSFSGQTLLSVQRRMTEQLIRNGCNFRFVICDPDCPAAEEAFRYRLEGGTERQRRRMLRCSYEDMLEWAESAPAQFKGRVFRLSMLCSILIVRHKDPAKDTIRVVYYGYGETEYGLRRVNLTRADAANFAYYEQQFAWIWAHAVPPEDTETESSSRQTDSIRR